MHYLNLRVKRLPASSSPLMFVHLLLEVRFGRFAVASNPILTENMRSQLFLCSISPSRALFGDFRSACRPISHQFLLPERPDVAEKIAFR